MCAQEIGAARAERFFPPGRRGAQARDGQRVCLFVCSRAHHVLIHNVVMAQMSAFHRHLQRLLFARVAPVLH